MRPQFITDKAHPANGVGKPGADEVFVLPATVGQQGFWYLDQLQPGNPAYNIAFRFRLEGPLRVADIVRALNEIVRRHESLRTVFAVVDDLPVQVIVPRLSILLKRDDMRAIPKEEREEQARIITAEEARSHFDLAKGPLFCARLVRLADEEHLLLVTLHHIISDGWSIGILIRELGVLYDAYPRGLSSPLPKLTLQFGDFAIWQEQSLKSPKLAAQISYWVRQLANLPRLDFPTDRPRPVQQTFCGAIESILLPKELTGGIAFLSSQHGATLFVVMLAAFQVILQRYTNQNDIVVGSVLAGRSRVDLEPLIGLFINPVVLRTDLSGNPFFLELLPRVRETVLQAFANQDAPFERVIQAIGPKRDPSRHPLFQINFLVQRAFLPSFEASGLTFTAIPSMSPGAQYDLNIFLVERSEGWRASCEYNTDLYEPSTIHRLLGQFQTILEGVAANPARRISEFSLTSAAGRELPLSVSQTPTTAMPDSGGRR